MKTPRRRVYVVTILVACALNISSASQPDQIKRFRVYVDWSKSSAHLKTIPTLQVVVNPAWQRGSKVHDAALAALKDLGADYVRFVPWIPYPKLAVAELEPPREGRSSWDFSLIDPFTLDFLNATKGHPAILNFSTEPAWMFKNDKPVAYPSNPAEVTWSYSDSPAKGLMDSTGQQLAEYYARLVSWYVRGGFTDEYGQEHKSGHHFEISHWEVLNEPDDEHKPTPHEYAVWYDAIVSAIRRVSPKTKFVGLALSLPDAEMFEYFLDPRNHQPGIPLDMISYHFYASPGPTESIEQWQYSFFSQSEEFVSKVRFIELIRKRLSPSTQTAIDEVGSILPNDAISRNPAPIPTVYWNLSGATYAYLFINLSALGIDVLAESALLQYPTQFPDVTMIDWTTGKPNPRYWILKLLKERLSVGDELCRTSVVPAAGDVMQRPDVAAQGYRSPHGERKLLLVNKRNHIAQVTLGSDAAGARLEVVDEATGDGPPRSSVLDAQTITLTPFAVAMVVLH